MSSAQQLRQSLPDDFIFGVATAAYQIEGAVHEDGRGTSIWDTFSRQPGKVLNGDTGDIACDHYHRLEQDLDLIASLGVDAYRFSIAWPRLFPQGNGKLNRDALGFYDRLLDGCKQRNLSTFATLYHWDLPQALQDIGGWQARSVADEFAHYAQTVMQHFGDRIDAIATFNEPWCSSMLGNLIGIHAPGNKNLSTALAVVHGQHRAHGLAIQAIRAQNADTPAGIVLNLQSIRPASDTEQDRAAAERHAVFHNQLFLDPLFKGHYPEPLIAALGSKLPQGWQQDLPAIHQPLDYWGLNYYTPEYITDSVKSDADYPATTSANRRDVPRTAIGWEIDATALTQLLVETHNNYQLPPCYITENGAAYNDDVLDGVVSDQRRIEYMSQHVQAVCKAIHQGVNLKGYFAWSLMDNFEWAEGYSMRFGIVHVDYNTQQRTLKDSALWYKELLQT